jgi:2-amino-4-hydroxy-6-hydroxymethyldihydropteridine diphosphokinase
LVDYAAMAHALVALGSNLGHRAERLSAALIELARLPNTRLIRRSGWFETPPIGGPDGQDAFLNGAALLWTAESPRQLLAFLQQIEERLGRVRGERWGARVIDLDLLLFDQQAIDEAATADRPEIILPHPRMEFRRFVLEPAAAVAPWMIHPISGWTVQALCAQLVHGADLVAVAAADPASTELWVGRLRERFANGPPIIAWDGPHTADNRAGPQRPRLILAFPGDNAANLPAFHAGGRSRRMPNLPAGPIAWIPSAGVAEPMVEAAAAIQAVWPELASIVPPSD